MTDAPIAPHRRLELRRTYPANRDRVFAAWTKAEALKTWWGVSDGYTVTSAEVDLRVGGRYRLEMTPPPGRPVTVLTGEYRLIQPPEKLVFTWGFENAAASETSLITLQFLEQGANTQIILTHEYHGPEGLGLEFRQGWEMMFTGLAQVLV